MSVGSSVALCQADTVSSSCYAQTEVILSTFAIPSPASPFQNLRWAVVAGLWIALSFVKWMNAFAGWTSWEASRLLGIWTSMPLLPRDGPSRINAFCTLAICSSVQRRLRWARELFPISSLARFTVGRHGCTCSYRRIACLFTHFSCQRAEFGAHLRRHGSFFFGRLCAAHVALQKGSSRTSHSRRFGQHLLRSSPESQRQGVL